jgi:hypothetical protein
MLTVRGVVAALVLFGLAGCAIVVHGDPIPEHAGPPTSAKPSPSAIVVSRAGAQPGRFGADALAAALLRVDEVAPGWRLATSGSNVGSNLPATGCAPLDEVNNWPGVQAVAAFVAGDGSGQLVEGITSVPPASAEKLLATNRQVIEQCPTITIKDSGGGSHALRLTEPSFPRLGDDAYSVRMGSADVFYDTTVMVRRGGEVLIAAELTRSPDAALLEPFARKAFDRLQLRLR